MSFSVATRPDDDPQALLEQEFDRWRTAIKLVQRLREAGIDCELSDISQPRN